MSRESVLALGCAEIDTNFPLSAAQGATNRVAVWQTGSVADLEIGHTAANVGPRSMVGPLETGHLLRLTRSANRLSDDSLWARWTSSIPFAEDFYGVLFGRNLLAKRSSPRSGSERESDFSWVWTKLGLGLKDLDCLKHHDLKTVLSMTTFLDMTLYNNLLLLE